MKRSVWAVVVLAVIAIVLYFVLRSHPDEVVEMPPEYDSTYIKIGVLPTSECLPFIVAEEYGISDSIGLKLHVELYDASMDADTAFQKGYIDGVVSDMVKLSIMESRGDSVSAVLGGDLHLSLVTTRQSRVTEAKNLKDKIVSITRNSAIDMYADKLLSSVKLESHEMNKPQINSLPIRYGMLCQNEYDGAILPEPWAQMSLQKGCHLLSRSSDVTGMEKMFVLVLRDSVVRSRHDDISKLVKAYNQSIDYINQHRKTDIWKFLKLLQIEENHNDSVLGDWQFEHAKTASEGSLSTARAWSRGRNLVKKQTKQNDVINKRFVNEE